MKVTCIVANHLAKNHLYLDLALRSVMNSVNVDFECICISDAEEPPVLIPSGVRFIYDKSLDKISKKINKAIEIMDPNSDMICFVSDDCVITKYTLHVLALSAQATNGFITPFSNSDNGSVYFTDIFIKGHQIPTNLNIEDIGEIEEEIFNLTPSPSFLLVRDWVASFVFMVQKSVWLDVGGFDEALDSRHNDQDFCLRAWKKGYPSCIQLGTFALHFGSKTLSEVSAEDKSKASDHFLAKHQGDQVVDF